VYGVDLTIEMLRRARAFQAEKKISNAAFACADGEQLPFPDGTFDLLSCQCSFHHLPKPALVLRELIRVAKAEGRLVLIDPLAPESDPKYELYNRIEKLRDPSHALTLRLTDYLRMFDEEGLGVLRQLLRRRARSFHQWMVRAGVNSTSKRYQETRKLLEDSMAGDRAGFSAQVQGDDIQIVHNEGMFLLARKPTDGMW
jgi:ubiquinone/menaquinone biosynthesis C-methylase UbiE